MTTANWYATLTDFKNYRTVRGITAVTDSTDDLTSSLIIEAVSRYIDQETRRHFFPSIATHLFDVPANGELWLQDDLLAVLTLTNGDLTVITDTDYILKSVNSPPYWCIGLRDISDVTWEQDSDGSSQQVISLRGWWGYHNDYTDHGWALGGTLGAAMSDTTTAGFTATAGHTLVVGNIIKIDNEIMTVLTAGATAVTVVARGDNGSTAATHINGSTLYIWNVASAVRAATLAITQSVYTARTGQVSGGKMTVTGAGVVIRPEDVPPMAQAVINSLRRME